MTAAGSGGAMVTWGSPSLGWGLSEEGVEAHGRRAGIGHQPAGTRRVHRPIPRGPDVRAPGPDGRAHRRQVLGLDKWALGRANTHKYTVAGQFRIRTGFPCGDSEHEHTCCARPGKRPHMLCRESPA
ncbi:hypothetical protein GCM10010365_04390 [Streptomyces poonensis]|uniref:Uncharacterized protein n=1 Tax=Streptomyces poonensis TaxID=68255 RepID=A0A918P7A4_9ACTN|nr:hypothetical protein GCM10010365_04390 [Streptomyces poonensis]GLJ88125.1 hypothetical protein GCM10017589_07250 [Streptomyces poonensis]